MEVLEVDLKPFECPVKGCEIRFNYAKNIDRHIKIKHSGNELKKKRCFYCGETYQNKANHDVHYNRSHKKEFLLYVEPSDVIEMGNVHIKLIVISVTFSQFYFYFICCALLQFVDQEIEM